MTTAVIYTWVVASKIRAWILFWALWVTFIIGLIVYVKGVASGSSWQDLGIDMVGLSTGLAGIAILAVATQNPTERQEK